MSSSPVDAIFDSVIQTRMYALIGLANTLASTIEDSMFWAYVASYNLPAIEASKDFHKHVRFSHKQPLVDEAVTSKLTGKPDISRWNELNRRIQALLGQDENNRNLVGHNPVAINLYVTPKTADDGKPVVVYPVPEVSQSKIMVVRGRRKDRSVGIAEMKDYCEGLIQLSLDLETFLQEVLEYGHSHPERCAYR